MQNVTFLSLTLPEIWRGSQNCKSRSRNPFPTPFDLIRFFVTGLHQLISYGFLRFLQPPSTALWLVAEGQSILGDEAEEFLLNLIFFLHFWELNAAFTVILLLMIMTTLIKFEITLLTRLASGCCRCVTLCVPVEISLPRCMECRRGLAMRILSVCLSVCLSVRHTRGLWQNGRKICPDLYTIWKNI